MKRQEYNLKILELLEIAIKQYPDMRFEQILQALNLGYNFYDESNLTFIKIDSILEKLE